VDRPKLDCNIHSVLDTSLTQQQVAELFRAHGWTVRKSSWTDHVILCSWAVNADRKVQRPADRNVQRS
jgi:hypothetical protein